MSPQKPPPNPVRLRPSKPNRKPSREAHLVFTDRQPRLGSHFCVEDSRVHVDDSDGRVLGLQEGDEVAAGHFGGGVGGEVGEDAYVGGGGVEGDESWDAVVVVVVVVGGSGFVWQPGAEGEEGAFDVDFWFRRKKEFC